MRAGQRASPDEATKCETPGKPETVRSDRARSRLWALLTGALLAGGSALICLAAMTGVHVAGAGASPSPSDSWATAQGTQRYGLAPSYRLTDQEDQPFSSTSLAGKLQVVTYLFPYCTSYCPVIARTLERTEQLADHNGLRGKVNYVAFNVDPGGAGPSQLRTFLAQYGIDPRDPDWHFLTGPAEAVRHVVTDGFHIYYQRVTLASERREENHEKRAGTYRPQPSARNPLASRADVDYDIVHNDTVEVVDPSGRITSLFVSGDSVTPQRLLRAITRAAQ